LNHRLGGHRRRRHLLDGLGHLHGSWVRGLHRGWSLNRNRIYGRCLNIGKHLRRNRLLRHIVNIDALDLGNRLLAARLENLDTLISGLGFKFIHLRWFRCWHLDLGRGGSGNGFRSNLSRLRLPRNWKRG
jgi:hypothetical protein